MPHQQVVRPRRRGRKASTARKARATSRRTAADAVREELARFLDPREVVVVTRERLQEALDEAVAPRAHDARRRGDAAGGPAGTRARADRRAARGHRGPAQRRQPRHPQGRPGSAERVLREVDRARRVAGVGPSFPILGYDDLTAAQVNDRLGDLDAAPSCARCATTRSATRTASRSSRRSSRSSSSSRPLSSSEACPPPPHLLPPAPRRRARAHRRLARLRRQRRRAPRRLRRLRRRRHARRPRARRRRQGQARLRRGPRASRSSSPRRSGMPEVADHPGAPWQVLPYERQLEVKARAGRGRADAGSAGSRASSSSRSSPPSSSGATATSSSTPSAPATPASSCAASTPPGASTGSSPMTDCKLASERGNELREEVLAECRAQGLGAWDRRDQQRLPAQPRRPRGPPHRASSRSASSPRPASSTSTR